MQRKHTDSEPQNFIFKNKTVYILFSFQQQVAHRLLCSQSASILLCLFLREGFKIRKVDLVIVAVDLCVIVECNTSKPHGQYSEAPDSETMPTDNLWQRTTVFQKSNVCNVPIVLLSPTEKNTLF